jgi:hypothetical protein
VPEVEPKPGARRQTSAQEGSWRRTCGSDSPPPWSRGVSTCGGWQGSGRVVHCQQVASSYGLDPKKRQVGASERDEFLRAAWRALIAERIDAERLVFVDEMGSNTSLAPVHTWAPCGERAYCSVLRNRGKNTTLLASMTSEGVGPCVAVVGSTTAAVFEAYVEQALAPALRPRQVVMDNLGAHKGERVSELIEGIGCEL